MQTGRANRIESMAARGHWAAAASRSAASRIACERLAAGLIGGPFQFHYLISQVICVSQPSETGALDRRPGRWTIRHNGGGAIHFAALSRRRYSSRAGTAKTNTASASHNELSGARRRSTLLSAGEVIAAAAAAAMTSERPAGIARERIT